MIIDIHHHLNKKYYSSLEAYLDELIFTGEKFKVDKFCVSALGEFFGNFGNEEVEYVIRKLPELIIGFAHIDLDQDKPEKIKVFHEQGFKGVKFICPAKNYDDESYFDIYSEVAKYKMVSLFHTGILAPTPLDRIKHASSDRMRPIRLEAIARTFPELYIIGAHFGAPWFEEANAVMRVNGNVYFDISGGALDNSPEIFRKLIEPVAFEKFIFGSDSLARDFEFPYQRCQKFFNDLRLAAEIQKKIMGKNAAKILGIN